MSNGVIRSKSVAVDGDPVKNDGTVQEITGTSLGMTFPFTNQTITGIAASTTSTTANVTFDITRDSDGNRVATNVQPID